MTSTETRKPIWPADRAALIAFWNADQALIDSMVAYPACPEGVDEDECEHWSHQPLKTRSGEMLSALFAEVLGEELAHTVLAEAWASPDFIEAVLVRFVRDGRPV